MLTQTPFGLAVENNELYISDWDRQGLVHLRDPQADDTSDKYGSIVAAGVKPSALLFSMVSATEGELIVERSMVCCKPARRSHSTEILDRLIHIFNCVICTQGRENTCYTHSTAFD